MPQIPKEAYKAMVESRSPASPIAADCLKAFIVGGLICCLGQALIDMYKHIGLPADDAGAACSITLVALAALATGLGLYEKLGRFAGAGSFVPITGFSNAMASPALEFKKEGLVFGIGAKMFVVAGPVILYGLVTSFVCGIIQFIVNAVVK
ncbi:MAG: stage V sporulation protein AC [Clostridiales bacterium]|jgi:stage V sporulation protein AC|nr:stage V sporulation protein AC [Clostridiales bacterium]